MILRSCLMSSLTSNCGRWVGCLCGSRTLCSKMPTLHAAEYLGRSVFSSRQAKRANRPQPIPEAFLVSPGDDRISVDRMDFATRQDMAELAVARGQVRSPAGKTFYGWAILTAGNASSNGRTAEATPFESNPYHADICLNLTDGADRRELQKQHSVDLAARARWEPAPNDTV